MNRLVRGTNWTGENRNINIRLYFSRNEKFNFYNNNILYRVVIVVIFPNDSSK